MSAPLITCENLAKSFGSQQLFKEITLGIFSGDKIGLIGPNGSGKSTLLKIITGLEKPDKGTISSKKGLRIGYVPQESIFVGEHTVEDILLEAITADKTIHEYERHVHVNIIADRLGFDDITKIASKLSGGWRKRLEIAKQLINSPDILFLDEPTNHLDLNGILWLEKFLKSANFAYVVISHDRYFLENVTTRMMELNKSYPQGLFIAIGAYTEFLEKREDFLSGQLQYERSLNSKVRREIEWLKQNPKARTVKSTSRINAAEQLIQELSEVQNRNKQSSTTIDFAATDRQTKKLITATNLGKSLGGRQLFSGVNFTLSTGTRLGLVGANGSGKTTLLKLINDELAPDMGTIKKADGLKITYFDQHRSHIAPETTLRRALAHESDRVVYRGQTIHVNAWCKKFLFSPDRLDLPISQLSGGEKARIHIARLMLQPADILLLDEPTNDLDIPTLEVLADSLKEFPGALLLITHDRYLLDEVSNTILGLGTKSDSQLFADYRQWETYQREQEAPQGKITESKKNSQKQNDAIMPSKTTKKLSFKETRELEEIEVNIPVTEGNIATMQLQLEDSSISANPEKLEEVCKALKDAEHKLETLYVRWHELTEKSQ